MTHAGLFLQTAPILRLPSETLVRIFEEVYLASCDTNLDFAPSQKLSDPALFPRCLANVCKRWKRVVWSVPQFATRVMVFVDEPIVLNDLSAEFKASKSLLINVFIVRRNYPDADRMEKSAVRLVVKTLSPYIARCQVLVFDLIHSTSLPHITDFSGTAPKLRTLRVKSRMADHIEDVRILSQRKSLKHKMFLCSSLQYLDLHGHIFLGALRIPKWLESIRKLSRKQLSVSHIHGLGLSPSFDLRLLMLSLAQLGHLTKLYLCDIELDTTSCLHGAPATIFIQNFELVDLSRNFISGFIGAYKNDIDVTNLTVRRCQLGKFEYFSAWNLSMEDIPPEEDISQFVSRWDGYSLRVENCKGVDDRLLETLCTINPRDKRFYAPTLRELQITFTKEAPSAVSVEGVKEFVLRRMEETKKYHILEPNRPLPMHSVHVYGPGPPITPKDKAWLEDNLEAFTWITPREKSRLPVLDGDGLSPDFSEVGTRSLFFVS